MRIGIDMDDVVVQFIPMLCSKYNKHFDPDDRVLPDDITSWDLLPYFPEFGSNDDLWLWVRDKCLDAWADAPPVPGALVGLHELARAGHDLVIITSKMLGIEWVAHRWLAKHKVPAREVHITSDKAAVPRCDVYLDDRVENVQAIKAAHPDSKVYLFARPHNAHAKGDPALHGDGRIVLWATFTHLVHSLHRSRARDERVEAALMPLEPKVKLAAPAGGEVRVTDPKTGGQKGRKPERLASYDPVALLELARVSGTGADKYEAYNYLKGYAWSLTWDAMQRHMLAFWGGEDRDPETGHLHAAHAMWHAGALVSFILRGLGTDDRPPPMVT